MEAEDAGSALRQSFDILDSGKTFEVGIDAKTRAVLGNAEEGPIQTDAAAAGTGGCLEASQERLLL